MLDYSEEPHREFVPHNLGLIERFKVSTSGCDETVTSELEDILPHRGYLLSFGQSFRRSASMKAFNNIFHHQYGKDQVNLDIVSVHSALGGALVVSGKIDEASDVLKEGLQMSRDINGLECVHPNVLNSLVGLGRLSGQQEKFGEA